MRAAELPNAPYRSAGAGYYSNGYPSATLAYEDPLAAGRRAHEFPAPLNGLELQPSEACPKNYVIFDQTCTKSRVTFHPTLAHKLVGSSSSGHDGTYRHGAEEDAEEIDALLSSDDGGDDDDVVSTGRTPGGYPDDDGSSPDTACSSSRIGGGKPRKKERMDTPAVLGGAVRYLKSLKVEAKKLGVRGGSDS
uniref:BHLH domain-containing protein n=1 Tax=Setaria italica TaxID=4555 RepID=K3YZT4_SETIT